MRQRAGRGRGGGSAARLPAVPGADHDPDVVAVRKPPHRPRHWRPGRPRPRHRVRDHRGRSRAGTARLRRGLAQVKSTAAPGPAGSNAEPAGESAVACSTVEQIGAGLDLGLPLIKTGARDTCRPTTSTTGQVFTITGWIVQALAWAFATLFVAGFTNAVRKT
jgi:hypothetical protein